MKRLILLIGIAATGVAAACSIDTSLFTQSAGDGGSVDPTTTSDGASSGEGGMTSSPTSSSGGTTSSSSSSMTTTSSTGTGGMDCAHEPCADGAPLMANCDPCVQQICGADPYCCNMMWDELCVEYVWSVCSQDCAPGEIACDVQYDASPGWTALCTQEADECEISANLTLASCNQICQLGGGECLGANNDDGSGCGYSQNPPISCFSMALMGAVCHCSRGCGQGAPCGSIQQCVNGQCTN